MQSGVRLFLVMAACYLLSLAVPAEMVLVRDGQNPCAIYHPARPQAQERTAARELAAYLQKMSGATFAVNAAPAALPERGIFVGSLDPGLEEGLRPDDYRFRVEGQRLYIVGGSPRGTLYGVYALLEEHFGCRWWSRDEEDVPTGKTTLALPEMNRTVQCPFTMYGVWNREAQSTDNNFVYKARTKGTEVFSSGHSLYPLLTPYASEHPEIYPMNKAGERKGNKLHFCYLAPNIAEALADALAKEVEKRKGNVRDVIYFAGMGDWYGGMCECPECKEVYAEETWIDPDGRKKTGYTGTLLRMINKTAEILEAKYPGIKVGTFAYMSLEAPPAVTVPRHNVVLWVPRLRHCTVHAATECNKNASFRRNTERWGELAPGRVYIWEYATSYGTNFINPFPCLYSMAENIKYYQRIKVQGVEIQGNYVSTGGDLAVLKNYVWRKTFWDPSRDARALVKEFCEGYYGPAAADIMAYVETLEKSPREPQMIDASEFDGQKYLTPEVLAEMRRLRESALAAAAGKEPYTQRVREATVGLEVLALWKAGPLKEEGDKLIRADLNEYSYPRALQMIKDIRGASPREWGNGRSYHMGIPPMHGGPLLTLAQGDLEVKVAPALAGRIRQISYKGTPLLYVENNAREKGYPQLGGSAIGTSAGYYTLVEEPTARMVKMVGETGIGLWSPATKQYVWQTVRVTDDAAIEVQGTVRMVVESKTRNASVATVYMVPKDLTKVRVEVMTPDGRWDEVAIAGKTEVTLTPFIGLRLTLLDKNLVVIDGYLDPQVSGGKITLDAKKNTLTTTVTTTAVDAPTVGENTFLQRRIEVRPLQ